MIQYNVINDKCGDDGSTRKPPTAAHTATGARAKIINNTYGLDRTKQEYKPPTTDKNKGKSRSKKHPFRVLTAVHRTFRYVYG